ncbi:MAG: hypothetical protein C0502_02410 [Opitutus sp.]|nr:hypothetical protein [Opitutus sp.]
MKILQIFGAVVAVHVLAFIFIFASPGCSSSPRNIPTPDATTPVSAGPAAAPASSGVSYSPSAVDLGSAPAYTPPAASGRAEPTRPGSPNAAAITPAKAPAEDVAPVTTYTVTRGDSLWSIAKKNKLTVAELAKANSLPAGTTLQPGKKLIIPGKAPAPQDLSTAPATPAKAAEAKPAPARGSEAVHHTVAAGESLGTIARKYQVTVGELAAANNITDPAKIRAGQQLVIPGFKAVGGASTAKKPAPAAPQPAAPAPAEPTVKTPHFEIAPPPPGQDLDAGLKDTATDVPTIKVEEPKPKG